MWGKGISFNRAPTVGTVIEWLSKEVQLQVGDGRCMVVPAGSVGAWPHGGLARARLREVFTESWKLRRAAVSEKGRAKCQERRISNMCQYYTIYCQGMW